MNVVFVTTEFVSEGNFGGGLASYLNNITSILAKAGHEITIITKSDRNETLIWKKNIIVERVYIDAKTDNTQYHWKTCLIYSYHLNRRLRQLLRKGKKVDIVQYTNYCALGLFRTFKPSIVRISSDMMLWRNANIEGFNLDQEYQCEKVGDYLEDIALKRADSVYGPSQMLAKIIGKRIHRKISVLESPFIQEEMLENEEIYLKYLKGKEYLLTASALNRMKGAQVIAEAVFKILDENPNIYYVLAGPNRNICIAGREKDSVSYIKEMAGMHRNRVIYLGVVERNKLYPVIRHAKAVVLPSRIDNLPNSCIEAMFLEKVVIGTQNASYEQLIEDGYNGYLIKRDSAESLVEKINIIQQETESKLKEIGERAKKRTEWMNTEVTVEKLISLYRSTLNKGRKL